VGEPGLASFLMVFGENLWKVSSKGFDEPDAFAVIQPAVSKYSRNSDLPQPGKMIHWAQRFLLHHWIPAGRGIAAFMLACLLYSDAQFLICNHRVGSDY